MTSGILFPRAMPIFRFVQEKTNYVGVSPAQNGLAFDIEGRKPMVIYCTVEIAISNTFALPTELPCLSAQVGFEPTTKNPRRKKIT